MLEAAGTKWNFLPFKPGLVGGHCIGVDPYYLAQKAQEHGYHPEIILAGRRLNDGMGDYVASEVVKCMIKKDININGSNTLILGITFKENCPDVRNTKIIDIIRELQDFNVDVDVCDAWASPEEVEHEYNVKLTSNAEKGVYDGIILAVDHKEYKKMGVGTVREYGKPNHVLYDVKHVFGPLEYDLRL